jgi:hypothetical protein
VTGGDPSQTLTIAADAVAFTATCEACLGIDATVGLSTSRFAGRLDSDLGAADFLCRRGHRIHVVRAMPANRSSGTVVEAA